jgi:two-component system, LytTR family, sensor kinase
MNKNLILRLFGVPFIGLLFYTIFYDYNMTNECYRQIQEQYGWKAVLLDLLIYFATAILIAEISLLVRKVLERFFSWEKNPYILGVGRVVSVTVITIFFIYVSDLFYYPLFEYWFGQTIPLDELSFYQTLSLGVLVSLIMTGYDTAFYFFDRWNKSQLEAESLKRTALQSQLDALKSQLDPHFLFNNFNTLASIIEEDPKLATQYVEKLSQVYRYVLQTRTDDTVSLCDELNFIESYFFLAKIRFGENLKVSIDVPESLKDRAIPPVTLQLLCENALKHNIVSKEKPLSISIEAKDNNHLWVSNILQRKSSIENSTQIGLQNIRNRYALLSKQSIEIKDDDGRFTVKLPLL